MAKVSDPKQGKWRVPIPYLAVIAVVLLLCILAGGSVAKYIRENKADGSVKAKLFYFTSDLLNGEKHQLSAGTKSLSFTVGNNADKLRYSNIDINYTVTVTKAEDSNYKYQSEPSTLTASQQSTETITVGSADAPLSPGTYTVTAQGYTGTSYDAAGYKETLSAVFVIPDEPSVVYKYIDTSNSEYVLLTVWSQNYSGTVTITYPSGLIPDNTDTVMRSITTDTNTITDSTTFINSDKYSSHVYRFFYSSANTSVDFTVTYGANEANVLAPN